ncbi:MAG: hypothetical protein AB8B82_01240 [Roseovarius sp.]
MIRSFVKISALTIALGLPVYAAEPIEQNNSNTIWFENWIGLSNSMLRVVDPEGLTTSVTAEDTTPVFTLEGDDILDGVYRYELHASTDEKIKNLSYNADSTNANSTSEYQAKPFYLTGSFVVERGVILRPEDQVLEGDE